MEAYLYYILLVLISFCFVVQLYYILGVQRKLGVYKPQVLHTNEKLQVSVIICARNEANNLKENLPHIFAQKGIIYEVIVVNDCSQDDSDEILREFKSQYKNLKVVVKEEHPRFKTGKKFAATLGIKAASHEILVFTDADCKPETENWLAELCANYENEQIEIVLGYSPYQKYSGLLNKLIRYETFQTALNYFSFAIKGMPYMGVGRNLSYKKSLFFRGKGFASHMHIPSGDDDLFVNQNATPQNTAIEIRQQTHVYSPPKITWKTYWNQKIRHLGAGNFYKKEHKTQLGLQSISAVVFYALLIVCLVLRIEPLYVVILFFIRLLAQTFIFYKSLRILQCKDLLGWVIFLDFLYYLFLTMLSVRGIFRKNIVWK